MDSDKIGKFIYELRIEKNLSQYQLADMIPITRQAVSKWERGVTIPDSSTLMCLSKIFDVSINELLNGERKQTNTIEDLQETTLNILDESNKKTKTLKRTISISITIITILLLSFLSYYFINSYNTTEVYSVGNDSEHFFVRDGVLIKTKEKLYLKLGTLRTNQDIEINDIAFCYIKDNKEKLIQSNKDVDNLIIMENYGYNEKGLIKDIELIKKTSYLKITYNDTETEILKLRYIKDFTNDNLFFKKEKDYTTTKEQPKDTPSKEEVKEEEKTKEEEKKEETKPVVKEEKKEEKQETKTEKETKPTQDNNEETPTKEEQPQEQGVDYNAAINKIKTNGIEDLDSYLDEFTYKDNDILLIYYEKINQFLIYENDEEIGNYVISANSYTCTSSSDCKNAIDNIIKGYLS